MRRRSKASAFVKVLSATAAFAAVTSGSVMAFAAEGYTNIQVGNELFSIEDLSDETYKSIVINAFNGREEIHVKGEDDKWFEISVSANVDDGFFNIADGYLPYEN